MMLWIIRLILVTLVVWIYLVLFSVGIGHALKEDAIAFSAFSNTYIVTYQFSPTRHMMRAISHDQSDNSNIAWSPDGNQIAFTRWNQGQDKMTYYIGIMDAYSGQNAIITDPLMNERDPVWSADGKSIAFFRINAENKRDLFIRDLKSGYTHQLGTNYPFYYAPTWSPDSQYISVPTVFSKTIAIAILDPQTNHIAPLVQDVNANFNAWSPDGRYLLYSTATHAEGIYLWDKKIGHSISIYRSSYTSMGDWSPDGRFIVFSAFTPDNLNGLFRLDVTNCLETPNNCIPELLAVSVSTFFDPRWRPHTS